MGPNIDQSVGLDIECDSLGFSIPQFSTDDPSNSMSQPQFVDMSLPTTAPANDDNEKKPGNDIECEDEPRNDADNEDEPRNDIENQDEPANDMRSEDKSGNDNENENEEKSGNDIEKDGINDFENEDYLGNDVENGPMFTIPQSLLHGTNLFAAPPTTIEMEIENQHVDARDADLRANFSIEVHGQDDISTLADTIAESSGGVQFFVPPLLNVYAHQAVPKEIPLRHFVSGNAQFKGKGSQQGNIRLVPTEDTSHGSPKDESKLDIEEMKQNPRGNVQRMIFWISLIMAPVILITLLVLAVTLIRLRQDQDSSTTNGSQALTPTEDEGLNGTFPFADLTTTPSASQPPLANEFTSSPSPMPTSLSITNSSTDFPSYSPTESLTEDPTESPTDDPTESPTDTPTATNTLPPTLSPTLNAVIVATASPTPGLTLALTPMPTLPPTSSPTVQVTSADTAPPTFSSTNSQTVDATVDSVPQPRFPNLRFVPWQQFTSSADSGLRDAVKNGLGYDQVSWNRPGTASIESSTYQDVIELGTFVSTPLQVLGFDTSPVWNCWVNHYFEFNWDDLTRLPSESEAVSGQDLVSSSTAYGWNVQQAWRTLGWTSSSWESSNTADWPSSQSKSWSELTAAERQAAQVLCYNQELWDEIPIPRW